MKTACSIVTIWWLYCIIIIFEEKLVKHKQNLSKFNSIMKNEKNSSGL